MEDHNANLLRPDQLGKSGIETVNYGDRPAGYYTSIVFGALSVLTAGLLGYAYRSYLVGLHSAWFVIGLILTFGVLAGIQGLIIEKGKQRYWTIVGEVVALGIFFYDFDPPFLVAAGIILFLFLASGYRDVRKQLSYTTEIRFFANTRGVIGRCVTGILVSMILLYVPQLTPDHAFVSPKTFSEFFSWSAGAVERWSPGIPLAGSFGDFAEHLAAGQIKNDPQFQQLPAKQQSSTLAASANALIKNFSDDLDFTIHSSDTVSNVAYTFIMKTLTGWHNRFTTIFLLGWSVVVFMVLRSIGILFVLIDQFILVLLYEILLAAHVIVIQDEPTTKEMIRFK